MVDISRVKIFACRRDRAKGGVLKLALVYNEKKPFATKKRTL